jgi:prepilin-type N-terminal cleavage/methylation domain-containing protein/prepilin-type processing-associated H-X9-DG protein
MRRSNTGKSIVAGCAYGFTLIELLVVLAIIGVLVAMIIPSLKSARDVARQAVCQGRERQMGVAIYAYHTDNRSWFPVNNIYATAPAYTRNPRFGYRTGPGAAASGQLVFTYQVRPYLNFPDPGVVDSRKLGASSNIFLCPASLYSPSMPAPTWYPHAVISEGTMVFNYGMSAYFGYGDPILNDPTYTTGANGRYLPKRGNSVNPSRHAMLGEAIGTSVYFGYLMPSYLSNWYAYFHPNDSANVLFADGHVANYKNHVGNADIDFYTPIR